MTQAATRISDISVVTTLPFTVSSRWRGRMADRLREGDFAFPPTVHPHTVMRGIWADRPALVRAYPGLNDPIAELLPPTTELPEHLTLLCQHETVTGRTMRCGGSALIQASEEGFLAALVTARRAYGLVDVAGRRTLARTDVTVGEASTRYPDPRQIPALLATAGQAIGELGRADSALAATFAYCAAVHCHAFRDGNKRTARVLWAAIIGSYYGQDALPLALLSNLNRRAFIIQFRRVILIGVWEPFLTYLLAAAAACQDWIKHHCR